jgi:hypothetical protein
MMTKVSINYLKRVDTRSIRQAEVCVSNRRMATPFVHTHHLQIHARPLEDLARCLELAAPRCFGLVLVATGVSITASGVGISGLLLVRFESIVLAIVIRFRLLLLILISSSSSSQLLASILISVITVAVGIAIQQIGKQLELQREAEVVHALLVPL